LRVNPCNVFFCCTIPGTKGICGELKPFNADSLGGLFIARTGYTGEDGFEIMLPSSSAEFTWKMLLVGEKDPDVTSPSPKFVITF
jgi:glycine cleavage system aminomethyltransferase T